MSRWWRQTKRPIGLDRLDPVCLMDADPAVKARMAELSSDIPPADKMTPEARRGPAPE